MCVEKIVILEMCMSDHMCVIVLYFFLTSLVIVWMCVYAYTEPLGQHAGISELLLFIYLIYISIYIFTPLP